MAGFFRPPTAKPDGFVAGVLLSFLATAGLFYVNIMAAIVDGLVAGLDLTDRQAGDIGSANIYGAAFGAFLAVFIVRRIAWRPIAVGLLVALIVIDLGSIFVRDAGAMVLVRLAHGVVGGLLVGVGFAVIARTANPDRTFGTLLFVQFGLGGVGVMTLPKLVPVYGAPALFIALALFSAATLAMVPFLDRYPPRSDSEIATHGKIQWSHLAMTLLAIFLFQGANMALLAYILRLGTEYGLSRDYASTALGAATWVALAGPLLVMVMGVRFGRFAPLFLVMFLTLAGTAAFHFSANPTVYLLANCATGITWGMVIAYLLGMAAQFDGAGRTAAAGGLISKLGLATGPLLAGRLVSDGANFAALINWAVAILFASMLAMLIPAWFLDRQARRAAPAAGTAQAAGASVS
ncbi:MAG: hypothetical protein Kow00133_15120 [Amphiplicatus sp.]